MPVTRWRWSTGSSPICSTRATARTRCARTATTCDTWRCSWPSVRHYQAHLANRRAARPTADYRPVTNQEWTEFEQHFDKRKVELGQCGRPYATACEHEHACIRCPMLHVDPKMLGRLHELHTDLLARRAHAETEGWLGEIEGIDLTLRFLAEKRAETQRLADVDRDLDTVTVLGMPKIGAQA